MEMQPLLKEIRDLNYAFLCLVRKMLVANPVEAISIMGFSSETAKAYLSMPVEAYLDLANTNLLLCRIHFDDGFMAVLLERARTSALPIRSVDQRALDFA